MDENSREGESSENADQPKQSETQKQIRQNVSEFFQSENVAVSLDYSSHQMSTRIASSVDASGPSSNTAQPTFTDGQLGGITEMAEGGGGPWVFQSQKSGYEIVRGYQASGTEAPVQEEPRFEEDQTTIVGPPPSYSFVMRQKKKLSKSPAPENTIANRIPPPTYAGTRSAYVPPEEPRICSIPSFPEPIWRSHSQPALCPRCGIIILTSTHSHDSVATHVAALALCLFGCWPCCLLPYCMNICKNTFHHCPICQAYLGVYTPW